MSVSGSKLETLCLLILVLSSALLTIGCQEKPAEQYGNRLVNEYQRTQRVADRINLNEIRKSIEAFHAEYGRYPGNLQELAGYAGTRLNPEMYDYDPETGSLKKTE
ncbi:hypothetical protein BMS3Bbin06_01988 [bacterium BMS3Bbin06]|nr:hypothetical protein BMS3Abin08_01668 [bacterium BMS3Abin08]GBE35447.1 hypothetical protein BMS3Bbin06_01988 [bacterium BMS3Bbin06]HDH00979.1 hypothetical protein [Nitrospirota bacterium]HDO35201.1 hypothetical protein [Nitrospirota bacterium]HDY71436.1 hypothetical protein [Nitrospirota bacterium]